MSRKNKFKNKFKNWLKQHRKNLKEGFYPVGSTNSDNEFDDFKDFSNKSEVIFEPTFKVRIGAIAYKKLFSYVLASNLEVSGLGLVKPVTKGYSRKYINGFLISERHK